MIVKTLRKLVTAIAITGVATFALLPAISSYAQEAETPAATPAAATGEVHEKTLIDKYKQGGVVMHFLLLASFLTVWLGIDGALRTTRKRALPTAHVAQLRELFKQGDYMGAYAYAKAHPSPICDVVRTGVSFIPDGKTMTEEAMFSELNRINGQLQGRNSYLSVIGVCSPMIGLVGTVIGMMGAFASLNQGGATDTGAMAEHIGEVLVATASGLFVAIPAFILYYILRNRVAVLLHDIQEVTAALFRKMPYEAFEGYHLGDEEIFANMPNWVAPAEGEAIENNGQAQA
ncbi:MAG: MotA/TolQ/ExbB proton channel family protein [Puniceicoccales bacterium]|jgi:biopolymer transport protein ExbB|nr:MotA/TolQ/ExbB proton channel family protein [Puniceicoccales bacterium]